jgi:hypothetical protein
MTNVLIVNDYSAGRHCMSANPFAEVQKKVDAGAYFAIAREPS